MILRGHHLLCLQSFQGEGYDAEFVDNMQQIYEEFYHKEQLWFLLVSNQDMICRKCPNLTNYGCVADDDGDYAIKERDQRVIKFLGLQSSLYYPAARIKQLVEQRVKVEHLATLCQECRWINLCENYWRRRELDKPE